MLCENEDESNILNDLIEKSSISNQFILVTFLLAFTLMAEGYFLCCVSLVVPTLEKKWTLSNNQVSALQSAFLVGYLTYSLIAGIVADKIGRKPTIAIGNLFGLLNSALFTYLSKSYWSYFLYYLGCGTAVGLIVNPAITLIAEISNSYLRAISLAWVWILFPAGEVLSVVIANYFKIYIYTSDNAAILSTSSIYLVSG